jgi:hypothetical protein
MTISGTWRAPREPYGVGGEAPWHQHPQPATDWKKVVLIVGLGVLSWVATYVGMLELIEANLGDLPLIHKVIIGFSVGMLMTMVIWLLDQLFAPLPFVTKALYAIGYVFLTIISVGFGFGFYWKVLESRSEASRSAESAVTQVQGSLQAASTRLDQLTATLETLTTISRQKADVERANGMSCPASRPGDGPRRKMREDDAARFSFAADFVKARAVKVKGELAALDGDLARIVSADPSTIDPRSGTRNEFMKGLGRRLDLTVTGFNAFRTDPQLRQIRADLAERADKVTFADTRGGTYSCPDAQLQGALKGVVRAIDQLPDVEKPKIAAVEGSEATIEAFRRLTATFYGLLSFKLPPSADDLRELQRRAVQSVEASAQGRAQAMAAEHAGLSKRDYVPLAVALFVDLCLLLVSMGRPMNRLGGLMPKMIAAEGGPMFQILSRFNDIHRDERMRASFEIFRHVVFDYASNYYVAVPLDAPRTRMVIKDYYDERRRRTVQMETRELVGEAEREKLRQDAHLLGNLFASFEKENIFKRLDSRFIARGVRLEPDTTIVRNRLRRQGSKFAEADAFRVYKFNDGAWSEIILQTVMGAARRIESQRRDHRDVFDLDRLFARMKEADAAAEATAPPPKPVYAEVRPTEHAFDATDARLRNAHSAWDEAREAERKHTRAASARQQGSDAANNNTTPSGLNRGGDHGSLAALVPAHGADEDGNILPFPQARSGEETDDRGDPAMPNVVRSIQAAQNRRVEQTPAEPGVDLTLSRHSVTMTMPMDDPRLARTLNGLYSATEALVRAGKVEANAVSPAAPALSAPHVFEATSSAIEDEIDAHAREGSGDTRR